MLQNTQGFLEPPVISGSAPRSFTMKGVSASLNNVCTWRDRPAPMMPVTTSGPCCNSNRWTLSTTLSLTAQLPTGSMKSSCGTPPSASAPRRPVRKPLSAPGKIREVQREERRILRDAQERPVNTGPTPVARN